MMNLSKGCAVSLCTHASALAVAALLGLSLGLSGCKGDAGAAGAAGAAPAVLQAEGTIQGSLRDKVTQQPIVGALVDIGVATATTNTQGEFSMTNVVVPVDANNNAMATSFPVNINLRNVTSPVNMASATVTPRYADFFYQNIPITFTSLYTSAGSAVSATPVTGLVATVDFMVGKLAANITGVVADNLTKQTVAAGYTVKLVSLGSNTSASGSSGSGTGGSENIVGSTTTGASGDFTFANIESLQNFRIDAWNAAQTFKGTVNVTAPADGETKTLSIQKNDTVFMVSNDVLAPTIISVTPEQNADISPTGGVSVVFTFSEPLLQTADTSTSASVPTGLYNTVAVNYAGAKASNITHSLAWNATSTQLTVTIPALAAASKYTVSLAGTGTTLKDLNNNVVTNIATAGKGALAFTTNGSTTPAAPSAVTAVNSASLNATTIAASVVLDWPPVSGAKAYNIYRAQNFPNQAGQYQLLGTFGANLTSDYTDTVAVTPTYTFVSGQNKLTYTYAVRSLSSDGIESADSNIVTAQDNVVPTATIPAGLAATYTITFSEPVDETSAETLGNYVLAQGVAASVPTVSSVVLNAGLTTATLTLSAITVTGNVLTITGVTDIAGNTMTGATRTF